MSSSIGGVPPMPLTITATSEPEKSTESPRIFCSISSTIWSAGAMLLRSTPGSPWIPIPISISSSPISKMGSPLSGGVQLVNAIPIERTLELTRSASSLIWDRSLPSSAAAPQARECRVLDRDVVVGDDVVGLYPLGLGEFPRHLEVEHVARIVLHDVEDAGPAVDGLGRLEHLLRRRAREDVARARGVEHPLPNVAAVSRLVSRAAAGDEGDLALDGRVCADDDVVLGDDPDEPRVGEPYPPQHLLDDPLWGVDEFLHLFSS